MSDGCLAPNPERCRLLDELIAAWRDPGSSLEQMERRIQARAAIEAAWPALEELVRWYGVRDRATDALLPADQQPAEISAAMRVLKATSEQAGRF